MFTVAFHAKAGSVTPINITIMNPNVNSYLLNATLNGPVQINSAVNGQVRVFVSVPTVVAVVFSNGQHTINETAGSNFNVSFNIYNVTVGVGYYRMAIHWDPSVLSLQHGTAADVVEGPWMKSFGSTMWFVSSINNTAGTIGAIESGLLNNTLGATGNGAMFTVAFHAKARVTLGNTTIAILDPNVHSYLLDASLEDEVHIDSVMNGQVLVPPVISPTVVAVVFSNGQHTANKMAGSNFTVSFNIYNVTVGVGYYSMAIHWNPSVLSLKTGTPADVVEGPWMKSFGSTMWFVSSINNTAGTIGVIESGLLNYGLGATGSGTMFTVAFHSKAGIVTPGNPVINITIAILDPNVHSYLLDASLEDEVHIGSVVNGTVLMTKAGDLGGYPPGSNVPQFGYFDGSCGADDIPLFVQCYRGTAPAQWEYLGDLGGYPPGSVVPQFFYFDGSCGADDVALFIRCYRGTGP
jgi:hypothetical protein